MTADPKIIVTGATGLLGQALVSEGQLRGLNVLGMARRGSDISVDITNDASLAEAIALHAPSVIINCAAMTVVSSCDADSCSAWRINARAVWKLADLCRMHGIRIVQVSTDHYFHGNETRRHGTDEPVTLLNEYARTKFAGEAFAMTCPDALVARVNIVGRRGWGSPTFAEWAIELIENDDEATLFDDSYVSSIDVATCARVILDLLAKNAMGILNIGSRDVFTKKDFVFALASQLGSALTNVRTGSVHSLSVPRADSLGLDVSKTESILGYALPSLEQVAQSVIDDHKKAALQ